MDNVIFWFCVIAVAILYFNYIIIILFLPIQISNAIGIRFYNKYLSPILRLPYRILRKITGGGLEKMCLYKMSTFPSLTIRKCYYQLCGAIIKKHATLHFGTEIRSPWLLKIDDGSVIGDNCILDARSGLIIGKNVCLSSNVSIYTLQHNHRSPNFDCDFPNRKMEVNIGDRAWLGANCILLPGITIGEGAVVCAGAVVTRDIQPFAVVAGIPAKQVGERTHELTYELNSTNCWFY